jgi:hypothetical protein
MSTDARAELHLGHASRVRVVDDGELLARGPPEQVAGGHADPVGVQVGRGPDHAAYHHAGEGRADRAGPRERGDQLLHHRGHGVGLGRVRGVQLLALGGELARVHIHRRGLDAGTADVDAQYLCHLASMRVP